MSCYNKCSECVFGMNKSNKENISFSSCQIKYPMTYGYDTSNCKDFKEEDSNCYNNPNKTV